MRLTIILCAAALMAAGCSSKKQNFSDYEIAVSNAAATGGLPEATGGMTLFVNNESIGSEEVVQRLVEAIKSSNGLMTDYQAYYDEVKPFVTDYAENKISDILLIQRAKNSLPEGALEEDGIVDTAVDKEIRRDLADFNAGYSEQQAELARRGFDWNTYRENKKQTILIQTFHGLQTEKQKQPSFPDIKGYYDEHLEDFKVEANYEFRLVHIIAQTENAAAAAEEARQAFLAGGDEEDIVKKYSGGIRAASGGIWTTKDPSSFAPPYNVLGAEIAQTPEGGVSKVLQAGENYFVFKLGKKQDAGYLPFESVQSGIERILAIKASEEKMSSILTELIEKAKAGDKEAFVDYCIRAAWERCGGL